jgi:hypothetical protein
MGTALDPDEVIKLHRAGIGQARGTMLGILTSSDIAIMIDFDLKDKVINP